MKIIDVRMRPPFQPYLDTMFVENESIVAIQKFYKNFGMNYSESMKQASMPLLFEEMDRCGEMVGVVPVRVNSRGFENDALVDLLAQYPDRFLGACGLDVNNMPESIATLQHYVLDGPCTAAFMEPAIQGHMMDEEQLFPIYEFCEKKQIPLLISFGNHGFTEEYSKPILADRVAMTFPKLKMALCHGGWPWVEASVRVAFKNDNMYLSPDIYALHTAGAQSYIEAANYMLREKFLYGSAYPCVDVEGSVAMYLEKLRPEVVDNVMYGNAARFLGLEQ